MSQSFLIPFIVRADQSFTAAEESAHPARDALATRDALEWLLSVDDVRLVLTARRYIRQAARRSVRLPYGRALALVTAPPDFLASAATSGPTLFVRSVGAIPAGVPVKRFRAAPRPVVRPLPLP